VRYVFQTRGAPREKKKTRLRPCRAEDMRIRGEASAIGRPGVGPGASKKSKAVTSQIDRRRRDGEEEGWKGGTGRKGGSGRTFEEARVFLRQREADGNRNMKDLLGGKGAGLAEMTNADLPVPPDHDLHGSLQHL